MEKQHGDLYRIFERDQAEHPMPADRAKEMMDRLQSLLAQRQVKLFFKKFFEIIKPIRSLKSPNKQKG